MILTELILCEQVWPERDGGDRHLPTSAELKFMPKLRAAGRGGHESLEASVFDARLPCQAPKGDGNDFTATFGWATTLWTPYLGNMVNIAFTPVLAACLVRCVATKPSMGKTCYAMGSPEPCKIWACENNVG